MNGKHWSSLPNLPTVSLQDTRHSRRNSCLSLREDSTGNKSNPVNKQTTAKMIISAVRQARRRLPHSRSRIERDDRQFMAAALGIMRMKRWRNCARAFVARWMWGRNQLTLTPREPSNTVHISRACVHPRVQFVPKRNARRAERGE